MASRSKKKELRRQVHFSKVCTFLRELLAVDPTEHPNLLNMISLWQRCDALAAEISCANEKKLAPSRIYGNDNEKRPHKSINFIVSTRSR